MTDAALDREAIALFEAYLEAEPDNPGAWLGERTAGRPELLARVRTFIAVETRLTLQTGGAVEAVEANDAAPARLAGYALGERIGAGGMGAVFMARRDRGDFDHTAAIKIIRPGLLSQRLVERFRRERQILAGLRHPNIAQLFDGGETDDGSPYIVMEYIEGSAILAWAESVKASRRDRIDKLLQACSAVSFAHANLIVHRDITPSNVLVTAGGAVKLIDFGIARPAGRPDSASATPGQGSSLRTLSLTPGFAAPERMTGAEPTTATDIYSLGRLAEALFSDAQDDREFRAIIGRATAQAPEDRYASADQLAADLKAWGSGFPVTAFPGGRGYALAKFVRRHKRAAFALGTGLVLLAGAFVATGIAWLNADQARAAEERRFDDVRALATYLLFDLNEQLRNIPGNTSARADLAAKAQTYLDTLADSAGAGRNLRVETAEGLIRLAEIQASPLERNLGLDKPAGENLEKARVMLAGVRDTFGDAPDIAVAEGRIEAIASLVEFYKHADADLSLKRLEAGRAALERVPVAMRDRKWRDVERDLSRADMERNSANEAFEALVEAADRHDAMVTSWPASEQGGDASRQHAYAA